MGYELLGENKIIFPSAPVQGINNDQSLKTMNIYIHKYIVLKAVVH